MLKRAGDGLRGGRDFFVCGIQQPGMGTRQAINRGYRGSKINVPHNQVDKRSKPAPFWPDAASRDCYNLDPSRITYRRLDVIRRQEYRRRGHSTDINGLISDKLPLVIEVLALRRMATVVVDQDLLLT